MLKDAKVYLWRLLQMLLVAIPTVGVGAGLVDWTIGGLKGSLIQAVANSVALEYLFLGPWLISGSLLHTMLTRGKSSHTESSMLGALLGAVAGAIAVEIAGLSYGLGAWTVPTMSSVVGVVYGALVGRRSVPSTATA